MSKDKRRSRNKKNQILTIFIILLFTFGALSGGYILLKDQSGLIKKPEEISEIDSKSEEKINEISEDQEEEKEESTPSPKKELDRVKISMVGDNLLHMPTVKSGLKADGSYNYDHFFKNIKPYLEDSDIKIINQETILGGVELGLSAYPQFNSPKEVADAINSAGFNIVTHANNHAMDKGYEGIKRTFETWDAFSDILILGINKTPEEYSSINIVEINNIKIAVLSYTFSLNGIALPSDMLWLVNMSERGKITEDLKKAKEISDFILVIPHWGEEYVYTPNSYQKDMTKVFVDGGADLIIGSHPHVLQPVEWIKRDDGKETLVYYSLGNFISNQNMPPRMLGGLANIVIEKGENNKVSITEADIIPLVTHYEWGRWDDSYTTFALKDYTDELASRHGVMRKEEDEAGNVIQKEPFSIPWLKQMSSDILGEWYK